MRFEKIKEKLKKIYKILENNVDKIENKGYNIIVARGWQERR